MKKKHKAILNLPVILFILMMLTMISTGCRPALEQEEVLPTPSPPVPLSVEIETRMDPSLVDATMNDPWSELQSTAKETFQPNQRLYNDFYHALRDGVVEFDLSDYSLSMAEKWDVVNAMYSTAGLELYHVYRMNLIRDGEAIKISYTDTPESFLKKNKDFYARLSHLIYNVPQGENETSRYFSLYDRISQDSGYTDDMTDETTHTAGSIIQNGKGICGGYALLNEYILTKYGIPSRYLMNEPHAWNMVTLEGKDYITDLTWGAGYSDSPENNLRHILTSTDERNRTLDEAGYSGFPVYTGFYRDEMPLAEQPQNNEFSHLYLLYSPYALDTKNGLLYLSDEAGIHSMTLKGEERKVLSSLSADRLLFFDESLYFIGSADGLLYSLNPGQEPKLLFDSFPLSELSMNRGILSYRGYEVSEDWETLNLNRYMEKSDENTTVVLDEVNLPREDTLSFILTFSSPMIADGTFQEHIGLFDQNEDLIPMYHTWSTDNKVLTLRSSEPFTDTTSVTLKIGSGLLTEDQSELPAALLLKVNIQD